MAFAIARGIINHLSLHVAPRLPLYSFRILGATFILDLFHGFYPIPPVFSRFIGKLARQPIFKQTPRSKRLKFH